MGEIVALMELENAGDCSIARRGLCAESRIRRTTVQGVVDTGAVMLVKQHAPVLHMNKVAGERGQPPRS